MTEFYYDQKKLRNWAIISIVLLLIALWFPATKLYELIWVTVVKLVVLVSALAAFYVFMNPQKLAQIDEEGIVIDHNAKLKWADVEKVERVKSRCCCGNDFLRFKLKKGAKYPLTLMQKMSEGYKFGAFSVPLYAMTKEDAQRIEEEINKYLKAKPAVQKTAEKKPAEKKTAEKKPVAKKAAKPAAKKTTTKKTATKKTAVTKKSASKKKVIPFKKAAAE